MLAAGYINHILRNERTDYKFNNRVDLWCLFLEIQYMS
jgi:hypothetical protein